MPSPLCAWFVFESLWVAREGTGGVFWAESWEDSDDVFRLGEREMKAISQNILLCRKLLQFPACSVEERKWLTGRGCWAGGA